MEIIRRAKNDGINVTCEVAPHHLIFNENHISEYDTYYKMNPPLRTEEDNIRLFEGLIEGVFDVIATDHAPHTEFEKRQQDFEAAPFGITGLETALPSMFHYFISENKMNWGVMVQRYSSEPRKLLGFDPVNISEGEKADLLIFNVNKETFFTKDFMESKSPNTPFLDKTLKGSVEFVLVGNEVLLDRI